MAQKSYKIKNNQTLLELHNFFFTLILNKNVFRTFFLYRNIMRNSPESNYAKEFLF